MRTKTLLLTAALSAVGLSTSMAQVYSVNAVGFVNVTVPAGKFLIIANPLDAGQAAGNNTVSKLFKGMPDGFTVYKYSGTAYSINSYSKPDDSWDNPTQEFKPGEGAFVLNPDKADVTITFVGEVMQGDLSHAIPAGLSIQGSQVPQEGLVDTDLKMPVADGDVIYRYSNPTGYSLYVYDLLGGGWDNPPIIKVGEGFWVSKKVAATWTRTFHVN